MPVLVGLFGAACYVGLGWVLSHLGFVTWGIFGWCTLVSFLVTGLITAPMFISAARDE